VRLAARLTGWDVDILTPPEFQAGVARLDQTLKSIEGITQEHIDKIIALGIIDVRDIGEVGIAPLMEELGMDEELASRVETRCAEEAKIVAVEQEQKKRDESKAKAQAMAAFRGIDGVAFANPLLPQNAAAAVKEEEQVADDDPAHDKLPGSLEAGGGGSPETVTHKENMQFGSGELSPEEQAIQGIERTDENDNDTRDDEDAEAARLADGSEQQS
jgi:N utilization substance protein A